MLIYVIPFVLLLVVAIVLKKREASKEADTAPKKTAAARNKAKTPASKRKTPAKAQVVEEEPVIEHKQATVLNNELRTQIQGLIRDRNFFAAEAQINQALNKDNSQHELYLLLLEIHLQQKDEFAIGQLFNHLRSLELDETLAQAEQKKAEYDKEHAFQAETNEHQPVAASLDATPQSNLNNSLDFDALIQDKQPTLASHQAQPETLEQDKPLEFKSFSISSETIEPASEPTVKEKTISSPSDSLELKPQAEEISTAKPEAEAAVTELKDLEFSFSLDPVSSTASTTEPAVTAAEEKSETENQPEFKFSFDLEPSTSTQAAPQIEPEIAAPAISFDLEPQQTNLATEQVITQDLTESAPASAQTEINLQDPLVQSFPELCEVNEITLNLDLAQQYIQLGAYEAARRLLAEKSNKFSTEQQQQAQQLLNQIAS
jgi:FimV-like protein